MSKRKPSSVKQSRKSLRTSAKNRAKDWDKTWREYQASIDRLSHG